MNSGNSNYNLPPIRKIGPAVLPKPKNIKIQAGRVIRLEQPDLNNFQKLNFDNNNYSDNIINPGSDFVLQQHTLDDAINGYDVDKFAKLNNVNQHDNKPSPPHRAKLVQIPDNKSTVYQDQSVNSINTSQFKFPRKSSSSTVPLSSYTNNINFNNSSFIEQSPKSNPVSPNLPKKTIKSDIPIHINKNYISPSQSSFIRTKSDENLKQASTINFSSDGSSTRPTITITTNNRNNLNNGTSSLSNLNHYQIQPTSQYNNETKPNSSEGLSYNIPIQYVQKTPPPTSSSQQQTRNNFVVPVQTNSPEPHKPVGNKSNFLGYNNSNSTSYTIPVNMSLSNNSSNPISEIKKSPNIINLTDDETDTETETDMNENSTNYQTSGKIQANSGSKFHKMNNQFLSSFSNNNNNLNNSNGLKITEKPKNNSLDEVDLLKDLLMKNLNASSDPNFFGMCMKCNDKIYGAENGLRAMDQLFHVECFNCQGCNLALQGQHFYAMDKKSFCEKCYMKLLEKCTLCSRAITDRILRATGKPFHPECFKCIVCTKNLDGIPFTVDASNKIHCIDCFHNKYAPRCFICNLSIVPEPGNEETVRIVAMEKSFHVHCYKCEDCGLPLASNAENSGGCFPLDDHILCKSCNINRIRNLVNNSDMQGDMYANQKMLRNQMLHLTQNNIINNNSGANYNARSTDL